MTELDHRLRAMLHERAGDIDTLPPGLATIGAKETDAPQDIAPGRHRFVYRNHPRAWLLSAAAVAVIAVGLGVLLAGRGERNDRAPVGTAQPTSSAAPTSEPTSAPTSEPTSAPTPATPAGPRTAVDLDWFGVDAVADYDVLTRSSEPGYRDVSWRRQDETDYPTGSNGGAQTSAAVTVFAAGRYPAATSGILDGSRLTDTRDGVPVPTYRGESRRVTGGTLDKVQVPTIAWQYRANAWVVVQALTKAPSNAELAILANAVHPLKAVAITLPFRLASAPPGRLEQIVDSRPASPLVLTFRDGDTTTTEVQVHADAEGRKDVAGLTRRPVGGLSGYLDPATGAYVDYSGGVLTVGKNVGDKLDVAGINRLLDGLTWSGGDGSGAATPLRTAIGR